MQSILSVFLFLAFFSPQLIASQAQAMRVQQQIASGQEEYMNRCSGCHGEKADGLGKAAPMLSPKPRNLIEGGYKFRSTPSGMLPTVSDLLNTLNRGVPGTAMPSFQDVSEAQKLAIIAYIRSLRPEFAESQPEKHALVFPNPPAAFFSSKANLLSAAQRGKKLYDSACISCHGEKGLGDGPSAETLVDAYENPIRPANLTKAYIKTGKTAKDIFKVLTTGLDGSPMPSFVDMFDETKRWELVSYVFYLRGRAAGIYGEKDQLK